MNFTCYHCDEEFEALTPETAMQLEQRPLPQLFAVTCTNPECGEQCDVIFTGNALERNLGAEGGKYLIPE